jgi:hypothetical protein
VTVILWYYATIIRAVAGLLAKGILMLASSQGEYRLGPDDEFHPTVPMMLSPLAKELFQKRDGLS